MSNKNVIYILDKLNKKTKKLLYPDVSYINLPLNTQTPQEYINSIIGEQLNLENFYSISYKILVFIQDRFPQYKINAQFPNPKELKVIYTIDWIYVDKPYNLYIEAEGFNLFFSPDLVEILGLN